MKIKDNCQNKKISDIINKKVDNIDDLLYISGKSIKQIAEENKNFFIFPQNLSKREDDVDNLYICNISFDRENKPDKITTYNLMGFVGKKETTLNICSRFSNETNENDYFLYYMLQKIYHLNIVNLMHTIKNGNIWDFYLMTFPYYLNKALKQGLYKKYVENKFNDSKIN